MAEQGSPTLGLFKNSFFSNVSSSVSALSQTIQTKGLPEINKRINVLQQRARDLPNQIANLQTDLEAERASFISDKKQDVNASSFQTRGSEPVAPWIGYQGYEKEMKKAIMDVSKDERNFLIPPPEDTHFQFDLNVYSASAQAALKEDKLLSKMRFLLVPQQVTETMFWKNYFYRVTIAKQAVLSQPPTLDTSDEKNTDEDNDSKKSDEVLFDFKDEDQDEDQDVPVSVDPKVKESPKKEQDPTYEGMEEWEIELRKAAI
ncbi:Synapse-associated protein 1 [Choanephora cucurbitarum]|uniref:Synapse-associated protein 1 n=1 Tax=Choanephora cucurbitarum TaxID=101091 RepID=A0A1C7MYL9_9FUNG|nr:Synapse-associated protein 1 [Choanephora cucurbitarum]